MDSKLLLLNNTNDAESKKISMHSKRPSIQSRVSIQSEQHLDRISRLVPKLKELVNVRLPAEFNQEISEIKILKKFKYSSSFHESQASFRSDSDDYDNLVVFNKGRTGMTLLVLNSIANRGKTNIVLNQMYMDFDEDR